MALCAVSINSTSGGGVTVIAHNTLKKLVWILGVEVEGSAYDGYITVGNSTASNDGAQHAGRCAVQWV